MVFEVQPGQTFSHRLSTHPDTMGESNTLTALKGFGVKSTTIYTVFKSFASIKLAFRTEKNKVAIPKLHLSDGFLLSQEVV